MKTNLPDDAKLLFFILGVPRSGTTIVASLFNSLEDGFCLGEPHWYLQTGHEDAGAYGKVGEHHRPVTDPMLIMNTNIIPILESTDYKLAGYKETWHRHHREQLRRLVKQHIPLVDFFIIVFRDPVVTLSSLRTHAWGDLKPHHIVKDYVELDRLARHPKGVGLAFEGFCDGLLGYLNKRLPFDIEGRLVLDPTGHKYGDQRANRSEGVEVHDRAVDIPEDWVGRLGPAIEIWKEWKG